MKQKMKHLVSFIAIMAMLVSMFSVCVFPAAAAAAEDPYGSLLNEALVVNPDWVGYEEGDPITYTFRGKTLSDYFDSKYYFATFEDAWARVKATGKTNPVILLCAGDYTETMYVDSGVTLLGPNAGVDPNVKSASKDLPWTLTEDRPIESEAVIRSDIYVQKDAGNGNITIDGLRFDEPIYTVENQYGVGGALVDYERKTGSSEITIKNTVFTYSGNSGEAHGYTLYLRSQGHARRLNLENLYITGENDNAVSKTPTPGFIAPYFTELYADNIAYIENKNGFLASTYFWLGVSPIVEITNSCFYNKQYNKADGYVISMDNLSFGYDYNSGAERLFTTTGDVDVAAYSGDKRPSSSLMLKDNIFYNASGRTGVIHYEFTNARSVIDIQNNYVYKDDAGGTAGGTIIDTEFLSNSASVDQSGCIVIKNNQLIGAYKIPSLKGSSPTTTITMADNYFGNTLGQCVPQPVYMDAANTKLIRPYFWVNEEMTINQQDWFLQINNWNLATVNAVDYTASLILYSESNFDTAPITYSSSEGFSVQLYKNAEVTGEGVVLNVSEWSAIPDNKLTSAYLSQDPYGSTKIYAKVTNPEYPDFAPVYTITVENMGSIAGIKEFASSFPAGYSILKPSLGSVVSGSVIPIVWKDEIYLCETGKNVFTNVKDAIAYANAQGIMEPTIMIPAGDYSEELVITGTCIILGEQHGINPNFKPYEYDELTKNNFTSSIWTLNPERNQNRETTFHACIRVDENADNYRITIDGIKMVDGCSYVDDCARTGETVTIFKNVYADNAGGGFNRLGTANAQVFNFSKAYDANATDRCEMYMYDSRLDNFVGRHAFGPFYEKYVFDGSFFGNATGGTHFWTGMRSRDIADPYYAITNSCLANNSGTGQSGFYMFTTGDQNGALAKKTNIVYNFNGNIFYNATTTGFGGMEIIFTGNNMTFYLTNNTMVHTGNSGVFFASTIGSTRFRGTCPSEDVSDMIVCTGNRLIGQNCLPTTNGTGNGTMFDFSGNYFASSVTAAAQTPAQAWRVEVSPGGNLGNFTYEQCIRHKIDYTYMDWDMTVRSDTGSTATPSGADYTLTTGISGNGRYADGAFRDTVPADTATYPNPVIPAVYATSKILDSAKNPVSEMKLTGKSNTFYVVVSAKDGSSSEEVMVVIEREIGTDSELLSLSNFYIDSVNQVVEAYVNLEGWQKYRIEDITVSPGATYALYATEDCTTPVSSVSIDAPAYIKVVGEDGSYKIYTVNFTNNVSASQVEIAGLASVDDMTKVDELNFATTIAAAEKKFSFSLNGVLGTTFDVSIAGIKVYPDVNGVYTVNVTGVGTQLIDVLATSGNGRNTVSYTLSINKGKGSGCELISMKFYAGIGNTTQPSVATKTSNGYVMDIAHADTVTIKPDVSAGAIVKVYTDPSCKPEYLCANNTVSTLKGGVYLDGIKVYVVIEAEDGSSSSSHEVLIHSNAGNRVVASIKGSVGTTDYAANMTGKSSYTLTLPAGTQSVVVSGGVDLGSDIRVDGGNVSFFADPARKVPIVAVDGKVTVNLTQKVTTVYTTTLAGSFMTPNAAGTMETVKINPLNGVLTIYSDRPVSNYKDAASFANHWVKPYVDALNNGKYGIFKGDDNGKLNISAQITRYEIATIASRVMGLDVGCFTEGYAAVNYSDSIEKWAAPYVRAVAAAGVMNGHQEGDKYIFDGNAYATREQVIKVLVSACVINNGGTPTLDAGGMVVADAAVSYYNAHKTTIDLSYANYTFEDASKVSSWAEPYIRLAVAEFEMVGGSLDGGKLYLKPQSNITRAEVAKIVAAYYEN